MRSGKGVVLTVQTAQKVLQETMRETKGNWHRLRAAATVSEKTVTMSHASQPCWSQPTWETEILHLPQRKGVGGTHKQFPYTFRPNP